MFSQLFLPNQRLEQSRISRSGDFVHPRSPVLAVESGFDRQNLGEWKILKIYIFFNIKIVFTQIRLDKRFGKKRTIHLDEYS